MTFAPYGPQPGSLAWAARRIRALLDRQEQERRARLPRRTPPPAVDRAAATNLDPTAGPIPITAGLLDPRLWTDDNFRTMRSRPTVMPTSDTPGGQWGAEPQWPEQPRPNIDPGFSRPYDPLRSIQTSRSISDLFGLADRVGDISVLGSFRNRDPGTMLAQAWPPAQMGSVEPPMGLLSGWLTPLPVRDSTTGGSNRPRGGTTAMAFRASDKTAGPSPRPSPGVDAPGATQIAGGPTRPGMVGQRPPTTFADSLPPGHPFAAALAASAAAAAGLAGERAMRHWQNPRNRAGFATLPPPRPQPPGDFAPVGLGPPRAENVPPRLPDFGRTPPFPAQDEPQGTILIFPDHSDLLEGTFIVESRAGRRGNQDTQDHIRDVQAAIEADGRGWDLVGGGFKGGELHKERAVSGPGAAWKEHPDGQGGDGRPGSRFPDLIYKAPDGNLIVINTVDVDAKGQIEQRELDAADAMRRAGIRYVYLVKKPHQLKGPKRGR